MSNNGNVALNYATPMSQVFTPYVVTANGTWNELPYASGSWYGATLTSVNNAGNATGSAWYDNQGWISTEPVAWINGTMIPLGTTYGAANGINDANVIVGTLANANGVEVATVWSGPNQTATSLQSLASGTAVANAINNLGLVVGYSFDKSNAQHATLWLGTQVVDLNLFLNPAQKTDGWTLAYATAVSQNSMIIGEAVNAKTGQNLGFLLAPGLTCH